VSPLVGELDDDMVVDKHLGITTERHCGDLEPNQLTNLDSR
jgi:hypothetical protein